MMLLSQILEEVFGRPDLVGSEKFIRNLSANLEIFYEIPAKALHRKPPPNGQSFAKADLPFAVAKTWNELLVDEQAWASDCFYDGVSYGARRLWCVRRSYLTTPVCLIHTRPYLRTY